MKELAELVKTLFYRFIVTFWFSRYAESKLTGTWLGTAILGIHGCGVTTQPGSRNTFWFENHITIKVYSGKNNILC